MIFDMPPWLEPFHNVPHHRIPWDGGANYSRNFEDDEGVHSGTWTYSKVILPQHNRWTGVKAMLRVYSNRHHRLRATRYSLRVELNHVSVRVCEAACTSVRDAKDHANRIDLGGSLDVLLRRVYNKNRARCVFAADGTPLVSVFDDLWGWRDVLEKCVNVGRCYDIDPVEHWQPQRRVHHTELWGSGYCAGSVPVEHAEFAATLQPWT